jgi:O-antigen ligase
MAVAAGVLLVVWLSRPTLVLQAAIVLVVFLPAGLLRPNVHSLLNRGITVLVFGVWLLDVFTRRRPVVWTRTALLMLGFLAWGTVTLLWTTNPSVSASALQAYALRLVLFLLLVPNIVRTQENLEGLMTTLAVGGWALMLASVGTVLVEGYRPGTRFAVLEANENAVGILFLLALSGVLWRATQPSKAHKWLRISLATAFLLLSMALTAISGSRGSAISFLVVIWAFWVWKSTRRWATAGLLMLIVAAVGAPSIFRTTLDRFAWGLGYGLLGGREALWKAAWVLIGQHPWRGVGVGNAPYAVLSELGTFMSVADLERAAIHNPVLAVFAETGILGILLYLGVLGSAVWSVWHRYRQLEKISTDLHPRYFAIVSSVFLGYMTSWIKGGGMESNPTYFLMLALLVIPSHLEIPELERETADPSTGEGRVQ